MKTTSQGNTVENRKKKKVQFKEVTHAKLKSTFFEIFETRYTKSGVGVKMTKVVFSEKWKKALFNLPNGVKLEKTRKPISPWHHSRNTKNGFRVPTESITKQVKEERWKYGN